MSTQLQWRAPSRITVSGPAGWVPLTRTTVAHIDGAASVVVESYPVGDSADLAALAGEHLTALGLTEPPVVAALLGTDGLTASGSQDGTDLHASYALAGSSLLAIVRATPSGSPLAAEAAAIADSVAFGGAWPTPGVELPLRPGRVDFSAVAEAWSRPGAPSDAGASYTLTEEEAIATARRYGVGAFPGVDPAALAGLSPAEVELLAGVAWRSLALRGAEADPGLREALELAVSHDFLLLVNGAMQSWYAGRADRAVVVTKSSGALRLEVCDTSSVADLVILATPDGGSAQITYRADGGVAGGGVTWPIGGVGARGLLVGLLPLSKTSPVTAGVTS